MWGWLRRNKTLNMVIDVTDAVVEVCKFLQCVIQAVNDDGKIDLKEALEIKDRAIVLYGTLGKFLQAMGK